MRMVGALVALAVVGGCLTRDPAVSVSNATSSGNWKIEKTVDRITGAPLPSAQLMTRTSSNSAVSTPKPAGLQLTCFEGQPLVRFAFEFKVGTDANSSLGYRFDDKPGRDDVKSRILPGYQVIVIDDPAAVADFIRDLEGAKSLYVRIRSLHAGRTTAEFELDGSAAAVQAAFSACPLPRPAEAGRKRRTTDAIIRPDKRPS